MAIKIAVLGGKGGVGKTTVTANLSYALAGKSLRVAAVDSDTGLNCLNKAFRQPKPLFYLNDVLTGRCRIRQALSQSETRQSCYVLSLKEDTSPPAQNIRALFNQMEQMFDYILVDCPPGRGSDTERVFKCCDHAIVVFTPHPSAVKGAAAVIESLKPYDYLKILFPSQYGARRPCQKRRHTHALRAVQYAQSVASGAGSRIRRNRVFPCRPKRNFRYNRQQSAQRQKRYI